MSLLSTNIKLLWTSSDLLTDRLAPSVTTARYSAQMAIQQNDECRPGMYVDEG